MNQIRAAIAAFTLLQWVAAVSSAQGWKVPLEKIQLPPGFTIELYAANLDTARGLAFSENGTLFVGSKTGNVYAVEPGGRTAVIARGLSMPVGVTYYRGDLYVSSISKIVKIPNAERSLRETVLPVLVNGTLPTERHHGWKFIKIGPDGKLYVPVGAPCNVCEEKDPRYASILRLNLDGSNLELFASGVRNTVGFDWHPKTAELWFTDNGRDLMGDNLPPDELNRAPRPGLHYGFPYLHGRNVKDPKFWSSRPALDFQPPELELPAHVAALGMRFYKGSQFPEYYRGGIFIAEHGFWNRSERIGYRVSFVRLAGNRVVEYWTFAQGWLQEGKVWGRPADVEVGPDGSLYVADDEANCIYRIRYTG